MLQGKSRFCAASDGCASVLDLFSALEYTLTSVTCCRRASSATALGIRKLTSGKGGIRSTSSYRGVTHHCRTGRFEAHIWDSGKQVGCPPPPSLLPTTRLSGS